MKTWLLASAATLALTMASSAQTQDIPDNMEKLQGMQSTGTSMDFQTIEQSGEYADQLKRNLEQVELPNGFKIELYAVVPDARHIANGPQGVATFVGTRKQNVWVVTDRDKNRVADEVKEFAPSINFTIPNGVCFSDDGFLYIAEQNRVLVLPAAEFFYESPDVAVGVVTPQGELVPESEESFNHTARVCRIGPDDRLYISLGQPYNVPPKEKEDLYAEVGIGGIISMNRDGSGREVYATGVRNSVGIDFDPNSGNLWFTDNQVDGMGDDIPPGEINMASQKGQNFGFPWYGGGSVRTEEYKGEEIPADVVIPQAEMTAHAADLGLDFYNGTSFPQKYRGGIFSAQHGSWNRTDPVGARIMFTPLNEDGTAGEPEPFAEGWLTDSGEYIGRPVDVAVMKDGSLLVSDDLAGALYRISYEN
ncbi:putative Glucose/sorbosone dehydrogenase [Fulvimarina pelagi HTCC2506]|uniref:Glucose/sorbosone dehydrogenase n=2 Tax=Fulvimarina pelagi TaxID=217511 RepID=A0A0N7KYW6_9HYPH|nr:PQQ-dependent sugar dehydrogenase [Fulvimarina pelagi]EAU41121.1 putative Glucose/sorbosone dehydrogenase [Fulvimarina pelagi HTCC2506]BAT30865.1 glucose/sorbosone dehydrogenase [Fulvimarina pelagi]